MSLETERRVVLEHEHKPTGYDKIQNQWIKAGFLLWALTLIIAIVATAGMTSDIVGRFARQEINELRERVAILEMEAKR